jgi:hypothetical protein
MIGGYGAPGKLRTTVRYDIDMLAAKGKICDACASASGRPFAVAARRLFGWRGLMLMLAAVFGFDYYTAAGNHMDSEAWQSRAAT